jgi:hypothetical protein
MTTAEHPRTEQRRRKADALNVEQVAAHPGASLWRPAIASHELVPIEGVDVVGELDCASCAAFLPILPRLRMRGRGTPSVAVFPASESTNRKKSRQGLMSFSARPVSQMRPARITRRSKSRP